MLKSIINELSTQYNIVGRPIFLSSFFEADGKNKIFSKLNQYRCDKFENDQRILVVQHDYDEYDIEPDIGNSLIFLQNCLQNIDISNFFVIVISKNPDIDKELALVQQNYSTDHCVIDHLKINSSFEKKVTSIDSFCVLPWIHLYFHPTGEIFPCCASNKEFPMGDLGSDSIEEIVNGEKFKSLRKKMLKGLWSKECVNCLTQEKSMGVSLRQRDNNRWHHLIEDLKKNSNNDGSIDVSTIKSVDLRLSNVCNLKCRTCSSEFSSQIYRENKIILKNYSTPKTLNLSQRSHISQQLKKNLKSIERIYFAGGEPLLMQEHYELLEHLIKNDNKKITIYYNTNFSTDLTYKDINVLDLWSQLEDVSLGLSLDGHGKIFEYVRHGSKWEQVLKNIQQLKEKCPHVYFKVTSTVSLLSAVSIMELQKIWHNDNILSIDNFWIDITFSNAKYNNKFVPPSYSLQMLRSHQKDYVAKKIDDHCQWLRSICADDLAGKWEKIKKYMYQDDLTFCLEQVKTEHNVRDRHRDEDFNKLYPEFYGLFD